MAAAQPRRLSLTEVSRSALDAHGRNEGLKPDEINAENDG